MKRLILFAPLIVFAIFLIVFAIKIRNPDSLPIRSQLIGQPVPEFALEPSLPGRPGLSSATLRSGGPRVINVFASWCIPCRIEAPQLAELERRGVPIDGVAVRDRPQDLARFLAEYGDPFATIGADDERQVQMALGSAGVPETFVVDGQGIVRHQHIGAITDADVDAIYRAWEAAR